MRRDVRLKREARASCRSRGHQMRKFRADGRYRDVWHSTCERCHKYVTVLAGSIWYNAFEIGGNAVALNCD